MRSRKVTRWLAVAVTLVLVAAAGFWAGQVALREPAAQVSAPDSSVVVQVTEQSVGKSLTFNVTAEQPKRVLASNELTGVATLVATSGRFAEGDVLYAVAETPVRVVKGTVPFYRPMRTETTGRDVAQLKKALQRLGYLKDGSGSRFDWRTKRAVQQWQRKLGVPQSGEVALGELVAAPKLPSTLLIDDLVAQLGVSWSVASGSSPVRRARRCSPWRYRPIRPSWCRWGQPSRFTIRTSRGRRPSPVRVPTRMSRWCSVWPRPVGALCGKQCGSLPAATSYLLSEVAVVPPTTGPAVPVAAITTQANGTTTVQIVDPAGARTERTVTVTASQDGVAIVTGVSIGERVQVLSGSSTEPVPSGQPSK
ncbi:MAG: peptidoglycan-binding protein [Micropruina sp.]|nr:peptidoglycan-binding protein [Micropruina sp.]